MITITVETDDEEAVVIAALKDGSLDIAGQPFTIRRGHRSIGGHAVNTVTTFTGDSFAYAAYAAGGGGGAGVTSTGPIEGEEGSWRIAGSGG